MKTGIYAVLIATVTAWGWGTSVSAQDYAITSRPSVFWRNGEWQTYKDGVWTPYGKRSEVRDQETVTTGGGPGGERGQGMNRDRDFRRRVPPGPGPANDFPERNPAGIAAPNIGIGQRNGMGQTTIGIGQRNAQMGQTTIGIGQPNMQMGQTTIGIGQPNAGLGQPANSTGSEKETDNDHARPDRPRRPLRR